MECYIMSINTLNNATLVNKINQSSKSPTAQKNTAEKPKQPKSLTQPLKATDTYVPNSKLDNLFVTYGK